MNKFKFAKYFSYSLLLGTFKITVHAEENERPVYQPETDYSDGISPFINAKPRSLPSMRLAHSAFPEEAEFFCSYEHCILGLTRGIVLGGDVFGMSYAPLRQYMDPNWKGGSFYLIDAFGGFQIFRDLENKIFMNAQIGYRRINYENRDTRISSQGITTKVHYSHGITSLYTQGVSFSAFFSGNASTNNQTAISKNSTEHSSFSDTASYFYRLSQKYPTYHVSFPANLEIANWSSQQTDLSAPIRLYALLEPFYLQNSLKFNYNDVSLEKTEQNFGIRIAATGGFESSDSLKSGRFSLLTSIGIEVATSNTTTVQSGNSDVEIPQRKWISPYFNLGGSWQF